MTIIILLLLVGIVDLIFYLNAPFPERSKWRFRIIGGGIVAYFILNRKEGNS